MYTYIHTHTIVDTQEMHYLLLMIRWLCTMTWLMTLLFIFKHLRCYSLPPLKRISSRDLDKQAKCGKGGVPAVEFRKPGKF